MEFEKQLYEKLLVLQPITKAGVIEMLLRLAKEEKIKIGDFSRKYRMHSDTAKQASEILEQIGLIVFQKEGRKKFLLITSKGKSIVNQFKEIEDIIIKE